ncbi:hypothetical protein ACP4OV_022396 [Aristida adscensionis]
MDAAGGGTTSEPAAAAAVGVQLFGAQLVKPEPQEAGEAPPQGDAVQPESPAMVESILVGKAWLRCSLCSLSLKRPIYMCSGGHLACSSCRAKLPDNACRTCRDGRRGGRPVSAYAHCPGLDVFLGEARVPCPYAEYGCDGVVPYFQAADHQAACDHAPCFCPEPGCFLVCPPRALAAHLAGAHSWPAGDVTYGAAFKLAVPVPAPPARHLRLLRGGDASLFLVAVAALGDGAAVSLVHVRANAPVHPRFTCTFYATAPPEAAGLEGGCYMVTVPVRSTALADGDGVAPEREPYFAVPWQMLRRPREASRELLLSVRIDSSFGPEPPPR